ncbi:hypothetical protein ACFLVM_01535, partial [Chloroflexota bacterium]
MAISTSTIASCPGNTSVGVMERALTLNSAGATGVVGGADGVVGGADGVGTGCGWQPTTNARIIRIDIITVLDNLFLISYSF